jgi:hypothetical protein
MIPGFNKDGNLPEGVHSGGEEEFLDRFTTNSSRRKWLGQRLQEIFVLARLTGRLKRLFVWGSFVSNKESPNDIDMLLLMAEDFHLENASEECQVLFDYTMARVRFHADIFWSKPSIGEDTLSLWLDTYQTGKDFKRRGIVEVKL